MSSKKGVNRLLLVATLLLAFALRIAAIDEIPPGLSHDEAYNGVTAMHVLDGQYRIFFEINKGIEPLIIYLEALAFYFFGISPVSLRLVNIFCGLLTVALTYPMTARLFNRRAAWLATVGVAISFWAIFVSRLTLRAVTLPPLLILTLYFLWRGLSPTPPNNHSPRARTISTRANSYREIHNLKWFVLSGLAAGTTMYTYLSSRFVPVVILAIFGYRLWQRQIQKWHWAGLFLLFFVWALLFAPLGNYYLENFESFTRRSGQVSTVPYLLNGEWGPTIESTLGTLGMFSFNGDETDRYNLDGRPVFDWVNALLFYIGLGVVLLRLARPPTVSGPAALLLLWVFFMLLPDFFTDDSPHFLRTIGALPAIYMVWAIGVDTTLNFARFFSTSAARIPQPESGAARYTSRLPLTLTVLLLVITSLHTSYDYFYRWSNASEARSIYGADIAEIADYLQRNPDGGLPAISAEFYRDLDPFRLTLHFQGRPPFAIWFDGRQSLAFPPPGSGLSPRYVFSTSAPATEHWSPFLQESAAKSARAYQVYSLRNEADLARAWTALLSEVNKASLNINNDLVLLGHRVIGPVVSGGKFQVLLGWQALRRLPPDADYTFLVRLRDRQGHLWVEADGNGYAPGDWQPGVRSLQLLTLRLPGDLPVRTYDLTLEVVDRRKGRALITATGEPVIFLETLAAQLAATPRRIDATTLPHSTELNLANTSGNVEPPLALRGYELNQRILRPGDTLTLTLHWYALKKTHHNYQLEFSLINSRHEAQPRVIYRWPNVEPIGGEWPTAQWPVDYWIQDKLDLPIGPDLPLGQFELQGRWISQESKANRSAPFDLDTITINAR